MVDELRHRAEGQRVGEAVLSLSMEDLYQLVVASFPEGVNVTLAWMLPFAVQGVAPFLHPSKLFYHQTFFSFGEEKYNL